MAYTTQYMYGFSVTAIKLSVLAFYWRVFPTTTVRTGVYILGFLSLLWFVVITVRSPSLPPPPQQRLSWSLSNLRLNCQVHQRSRMQTRLILLDPIRRWGLLY